MTTGFLTMSRRELDRVEWMEQLRARRTTQAQVAERLGLTVRQVERLYRAYKAHGAAGLISKKRGAMSARRLPTTTREAALAIVRERYADFGPTLAHEKLVECHGMKVSVETLRKWMIAEGVWLARALRVGPLHRPRLRRACLGELVQIDGCEHDWFEARAPRCVALVYVDDATSRILHLRFVESESTFSYFESTRRYVEEHGKPVAFYSDKAGVFRVNAKDPLGGDRSTQFTRAMDELNVDVLCASSPQAKGRVERAHQTLQDRLVKELRLRGISTVDAANEFAPHFRADYNRRFGRAPASPHDAHRALRPHEDLREVFRWKEERRLGHELTVHYKRVLYFVERSPESLALRGKRVQVHETADGTVSIRHRGADLPATPFRKEGRVRQQDVADNKHLSAVLEHIRREQIARDEQALSHRKTLREKRLLRASLATQHAPPDPTSLLGPQPDISSSV